MGESSARVPLALADKNTESGCGCGCGRASSEAEAPQATGIPSGEGVSTAQTFLVSGMTCGHCVGAVRDEVSAIPGVVSVDLTLVPEGTSTLVVTATAPIAPDTIADALDEAGDYQLVG